MNRKFLEELGLEKEVVESVMSEYGKSIKAYKDQLTELDALKQSNADLSKANQEASGKYTQLETSLKEKQTSIEDLTKQLESANLQNLKVQVALENGVPYTMANRLVGADQEALTADAKQIAGMFTQQVAPMKSIEPNNVSDNPYMAMVNQLNNLDE
nr:MAG TPA: minor structural protein [Caudoviricetes sp.]